LQPGQSVTHVNQFDVKTGLDIWTKLQKSGKLDCESCYYEILKGELGAAVCCSSVVKSNDQDQMVFSLGWHQPVIKFKQTKHSGFKR